MVAIDNEEYRLEIASSTVSKTILVKAGPGSGKTKLLIDRLIYVIENIPYIKHGIACITYTNAAKDEIEERLQKKGTNYPKDLFIGTIHSFLLEYVIKPYSHFAHPNNKSYKVATRGFARSYKQEIADILNRKYYMIDDILLNAFESLGRDDEGKPYCFRGKISKKAAFNWKKFILDKGYIDQQDVIYLSYYLINKYEHIRKALSYRFPYILVDEYQDVSHYQEKFFTLLEGTKFFCVGDANQAIYSFAGSKPQAFHEKWANSVIDKYTLKNNFRSTKNIVKFANYTSEIVQIEKGYHSANEQKVLFIKGINEPDHVISFFHDLRKGVDNETDVRPYMILARRNGFVEFLSQMIKKQDLILQDAFIEKLKTENYRCSIIVENLMLAIYYMRKNELNNALEKANYAFSFIFFNVHPSFVELTQLEFDKFMWRKFQIFTLYYLDDLTLSEITISEFFILLKNFLVTQSKELFGKSVGNKIRILNYKWKNQTKKSKSTKIEQLIDHFSFHNDLINTENNITNIHSAKGHEAESVLVMAETKEQLREWLGELSSSEEARIGYVAFTRARKLLVIWAPFIEEEEFSHLKEYIDIIDRTYLHNF